MCFQGLKLRGEHVELPRGLLDSREVPLDAVYPPEYKLEITRSNLTLTQALQVARTPLKVIKLGCQDRGLDSVSQQLLTLRPRSDMFLELFQLGLLTFHLAAQVGHLREKGHLRNEGLMIPVR
mmetsp:Transcript_35013/g.93397  ORF Transcript_35013/g.93397 Transcript_35013/m.93397 type:complete len:123 (+) Transcript_35013:587-955(+)